MIDPLAELARVEGVPSALAAARDAVDAVLRDRGLRTISADQRGRALLAGARANAALSGDPSAVVGRARCGSPAELVELAGTIRIAPAQALARAHALLARGIICDDELGRDPAVPRSSERIAGLVELLTGPQTAPAMVLGAVVHAEIATAAPFGAASGLIARAAEHLVLISAGLDPAAVIVGRGRARGERRRTIGPDWPATGRAAWLECAGWIVQCAAAVSRGAELSPVDPRRAGTLTPLSSAPGRDAAPTGGGRRAWHVITK